MLIDFASVIEMGQELVKYIPMTLALAVASMLLGCILGLIAAVARTVNIPIVTQLATVYVVIGRALPPMIVLYIVFFGLPILLMVASGNDNQTDFFAKINPAVYAIIGLGLHTGAYMSEIFRSAIQSVPKGQIEAAMSIGMTYPQAFFRVILPQAAVFAMPLTANQFLSVLKGTSIAFMITVVEMFGASAILAASNNLYLEIYLLIACMYWAISIIIERFFLSLEYHISYFKRGTKV